MVLNPTHLTFSPNHQFRLEHYVNWISLLDSMKNFDSLGQKWGVHVIDKIPCRTNGYFSGRLLIMVFYTHNSGKKNTEGQHYFRIAGTATRLIADSVTREVLMEERGEVWMFAPVELMGVME